MWMRNSQMHRDSDVDNSESIQKCPINDYLNFQIRKRDGAKKGRKWKCSMPCMWTVYRDRNMADRNIRPAPSGLKESVWKHLASTNLTVKVNWTRAMLCKLCHTKIKSRFINARCILMHPYLIYNLILGPQIVLESNQIIRCLEILTPTLLCIQRDVCGIVAGLFSRLC